ncbi:cytochrome c oxidase subunit 3 [Acidobacteria bacterium AH-259-A15]|nr:cytochrome c oxidase subunit 3 [Acidobacteria bacterium AH-259-A15]
MLKATHDVTQSSWGGGISPFAVGWNKLMMWLFIITDGLLFAGFLASYGFARLSSSQWPDQLEVFHLWFIALMTFILISSSATMATAVRGAEQGHRATVLRFLLLTIVGGLVFLGMQAYEWATLIREGAGLYSNPWGVPQFTGYFFLTTGFHGSHVFTGVLILSITAVRWKKGLSSAEGVELTGLYWHFVDLVWVFIFTLFYLI